MLISSVFLLQFVHKKTNKKSALTLIKRCPFCLKNSKITAAFGDAMSSQIPLKYQQLMARVSDKNNNSKAEAIKAFCLQCVDYKFKRVRYCSASHCALFHVRPYQSKTTD